MEKIRLSTMRKQEIIDVTSLSNIVPKTARYAYSYDSYGEDSRHGAAHVKLAVIGPSQAIPVVGK
jgi:thiamine phosphate synthase YjbQ (UPF0047 family)